jgi:hypothetical protein
MGLYACVVLQLVLDSIPVAEGNLVAVDIPVEGEGNLEEKNSLAMTDSLVAVDIPVAEGNLVVAHTPGVDILEVAFVAQPCRIVVAHVDQDLSHSFLLLAVRVVVFLLVVRMAVPGYSYITPYWIF